MTRNTLDSLLVTLDPTAAAAAASAAILRLSGLAAGDIDVVILSEPNDPTDRFRAVVSNGILRIEASSARAAVSAYARYVRSTGEAHVARFGTRQPDGTLEDGEVLEGRASLDHRVAYNFTVSGYTTPYFNWAQWEQEIDLLAASGVTSAHITLGQEVVWLRTFTQFGYSQEEILRWICPPSHQPWQWLNNIQNFGEGTTLELIERRVELARRVIGRLRELGITPILPGFSGTVPQQFAERNADSPTVPQGKWFMDLVGPERPDWLSTTTEGYAAVSRVFYNEQFAAFGVSGVWAIDLLHEGGKTGSFEIGAAARGVEAALAAANPDYTWVIQAWAGNPRKQLLEAIDLSKVIILDLTGEAAAQLDSFDGSDWALGILPNYGGRTVLYGDLVAIAELPGQWSGAAELSGLRGLTNMAEGVGNNPVVWDLFSDLAWEHQEVDLPGWLEEWLRSRYGAHNQNAIDAWGDLLGSVYGPWRHDGSAATPFESSQALQGSSVDAGMSLQARGRSDIQPLADAEAEFGAFGFYASTDSVIGSIPSLYANQASTVGPRSLGYDPTALVPVVRRMLAAATEISTPGFNYDLVDITRQLADDVARDALGAIATAAEAADLPAYDSAVDTFLELIDALDALLASNGEFLLGRWESEARSWGNNAAEGEYLASEARRLLTCWGYDDSMLLTEYATRSWAGLVGDYFKGRWTIWFDQTRRALAGEQTTPIDWYAIADNWVRTSPQHASTPEGDSRRAAAAVLELAERIRPAHRN